MSDRGPIEYDIETNTYRVQYDFASVEPSVAVVETLESITERESATLPPLYEVIDPEGLDTVLEHAQRTRHTQHLTVSFRYHEFLVTVSGDGTIEVAVIDDEDSSDE
ncbi:HalOD1 output domain-containing protein [Natrinema sp. LN54]|uniref:HalOD1 output domain-containing protein n=1 Tax=Natrinema sp. LN54 TaxID=3458705 RepID=UPI00403616C2